MRVFQPGQQFGTYRLDALISRGGMGEVWRATKTGAEGWSKVVALKLILPGLDEAVFAELLQAEARIAAHLNHANVAQVLAFGREEQLLFIEMEYVAGHDLNHVLRDIRGGIPVSLTLYIVGEMLKALEYAHDYRDADGRLLGIVHRDIKPHNVLVSYEGAIKLSDFGIAKVTGASNRSASALKGTAGYIAPELLEGQPATPRSDLFATGLVLWECLTGTKLFDGDTEAARLRKALDCVVPPLTDLAPHVPPAVEAVLRRLLAKEVAGRYQSATEVLSDLLATPWARQASSLEMRQLMMQLYPSEGRSRYASPVQGVLPVATPSVGPQVAPTMPLPPTPASLAAASPAPTMPPPALGTVQTPPAAAPTRVPARPPARGSLALAVFGVVAVAAGVAVWRKISDSSKPLGPPATAGVAQLLGIDAALDAPELVEKERQSDAPADAAPEASPALTNIGAAQATENRPADSDPVEPAPSVRRGTLQVRVQPWADVYVDGKRVGTSPVTIKLSPGEHKVRLVNDEIGRVEKLTVKIQSGTPTTIERAW